MSSINDTSDFTGTYSEGSFTRDDESFSRTEKANNSTQMSFTPSRISASDGDLVTGSISDEETPIYDDDYTSGYDSRVYDTRTYDTFDSRTYDDSFPQSPISDELSSTFASFYRESEPARKVRSAVSFLRRPLVFCSIAMSGSGFVSAICRVVYMVTTAANAQQQMLETPNNLGSLPEGFASMPQWMCDARKALPSVVEFTVKKVLAVMGIRSISDLQEERWKGAIKSFTRAKHELTQITSGPMVPLFIFLPLFSFAVLSVAQHVIARQTLPRDDIEEGEFDILDENLEVETRENLSNANGDSGDLDFKNENHSEPMAVSDNDQKFSQQQVYPKEEFKDDKRINGELGFYEDSVEESVLDAKHQVRLDTHPPSESPTDPHGILISRNGSPNSLIKEDVPKKSESSTLSAPSSKSQELRLRDVAAPYALRGNVVVAIAGDPSPAEVNVLIIAAARYSCQKLILPLTVSESAWSSVAPSLSIERVENVIDYVMDVEEPRGLTSVGVFIRPVSVNTVELPLFTHPHSAVYVFVPASGTNETMVASLVQHSLFTSLSDDEPIPVNACFYDRSLKERQIPQ